MTKIPELFGHSTAGTRQDWKTIVAKQHCPYLNRECLKVRKSNPSVAIGTCSMLHGENQEPVIICPYRLLERRQIFTDCFHLLTSHEVGNELHILSEITVPGGSVDYVLASVANRKIRDFVGIELQTLDSTGTVWPERQRFLKAAGLPVRKSDAASAKPFGMNWKMTAKTTLLQLHHKVRTFEHINKHLVLVLQDCLLHYMRQEFRFDHMTAAKLGDSMHMHAYAMKPKDDQSYRIELKERCSTDSAGIAQCLGLQAEAKIELTQLVKLLESKISDDTLFKLQ